MEQIIQDAINDIAKEQHLDTYNVTWNQIAIYLAYKIVEITKS